MFVAILGLLMHYVTTAWRTGVGERGTRLRVRFLLENHQLPLFDGSPPSANSAPRNPNRPLLHFGGHLGV